MPRGKQVLQYVARHRLRDWLALDDRSDGFEEYPDRLIHCRPGIGLGDEAMQNVFAARLRLMFGV